MLGPRYRVVVETGDTSQQAQIRTLVPGAFRSSYQGRAVVQVGSFKERSKADEMLQIMNSNGFNAVIDAIQ
jgi:cell division septation protein DedD